MDRIKKALVITLAVLTASWSVGFSFLAPLSAAAATSAAASNGDLVKASNAAVYYVGANGKRYVFPNEKTYKTWWSNFSSVQTITDTALASIGIGGNVTYRPGSRLAKITTDPKVYMVGGGAMLYSVADEATAKALFGNSWSDLVDDVPDAFFTNYSVANRVIAAANADDLLPDGTLIKHTGTGEYLLVGAWLQSEGRYELWKVTGDVSIYKSVVMASSEQMVEDWTGTMPSNLAGTVDAQDIFKSFAPDRSGNKESSSNNGGNQNIPYTGEFTAQFGKWSGDLQVSSNSNAVATAPGKFCNKSADTVQVREVHLDLGGGSVRAQNLLEFAVIGGYYFDETGTSNGDSISILKSKDGVLTMGPGACVDARISVTTANNNGRVVVKLAKVVVDVQGSAAAAVSDVMFNQTLIDARTIASNASDLADINFSSVNGPTTLQLNGTLDRLWGIQASASGNDVTVVNPTLRVTGSFEATDCEFRVNGVVMSDNTMWTPDGRYMYWPITFTMDEGSDSWELYCVVLGEASRTVNISLSDPSHMTFYDANSTPLGVVSNAGAAEASAFLAQPTDRVQIFGNQISPLNFSISITFTGGSLSIAVLDPNNVKKNGAGLDEEVIAGATDQYLFLARVVVTGARARVSSLSLNVTAPVGGATVAARGFKNVQIAWVTCPGGVPVTGLELNGCNVSNYGGEIAALTGTIIPVTSNQLLEPGEYLLMVTGDIITNSSTYVSGDDPTLTFQNPGNNVSFDEIGTTASFPTAATTAIGVIVRPSGTLTIGATTTIYTLVNNSKNRVVGQYLITGNTVEDTRIDTVSITFNAQGGNSFAGNTGCVTTELRDGTGKVLSSAQTLTATTPASNVTLSFSVTGMVIKKNEQFTLQVFCIQAGSTVAAFNYSNGATTLATLVGTGVLSNQSFNLPLGTTGNVVTVSASGAATYAQGFNGPNKLLGPQKVENVMNFTTTNTKAEPTFVRTVSLSLTVGGAASADEVRTVNLYVTGFSGLVGGNGSRVLARTRTVTGSTVVFSFNDDELKLAESATGKYEFEVVGNTVGNIGLGAAPQTDNIAFSMATTTGNTVLSSVTTVGVDSRVVIAPTNAGATTVTGNTVTPSAAQVEITVEPNQTFGPGKIGMELLVMKFLVTGTNATLVLLNGTCSGLQTAGICENGFDTVDLELDGTPIPGQTGVAIALGGAFSFAAINQLLVQGTTPHSVKVILNDNAGGTGICSGTGESVQLIMTDLDFTVVGPLGTQSFSTNTFVGDVGGAATSTVLSILVGTRSVAGDQANGLANLCG